MVGRWRLGLAAGVLGGTLVAVPAGAAPPSLVRIHVEDAAELDTLRALGLDILADRPGPGWVDVRVPAAAAPGLALTAFETRVVVPDLDAALERFEREHRPASDHTDAFFDAFRELDEIASHMADLATARPDLVTPLHLGDSLEGRELGALRISNAGEDAPVVLVTAGQHAREWIAVMSGICVADSLVTRADETEIATLLSQVTFVVLPVANPDGYVYAWEDDRFWRKNRRNGLGVDTNRNFGIGWGGEGASDDPEAGNYRGEGPFSEPETAAIRDYVETLPDLRAHLDVHSFGQLVLHPWGHVYEPAPAAATLESLSDDIATAMAAPFGVGYQAIAGVDLYPAAGNAVDWAYGQHGAMAFTLELRPDEVEQFELGFVLLPEQIEEVCLETMAAVTTLGQWAATSTPGMAGDTGDVDPGTTGGSTDGDDSGSTSIAATTGPGPIGTSSTTIPPVETATGWTGPIDEEPPAEDASDDGCGCRSDPAHGGLWALLLALAFAARRGATPRRPGGRAGYEL